MYRTFVIRDYDLNLVPTFGITCEDPSGADRESVRRSSRSMFTSRSLRWRRTRTRAWRRLQSLPCLVPT